MSITSMNKEMVPRRDFLRNAVMLAGAGVTAPLWAAMKYDRNAVLRYFREVPLLRMTFVPWLLRHVRGGGDLERPHRQAPVPCRQCRFRPN
jgi:hypothetical protein